MKTYNPFGS